MMLVSPPVLRSFEKVPCSMSGHVPTALVAAGARKVGRLSVMPLVTASEGAPALVEGRHVGTKLCLLFGDVALLCPLCPGGRS